MNELTFVNVSLVAVCPNWEAELPRRAFPSKELGNEGTPISDSILRCLLSMSAQPIASVVGTGRQMLARLFPWGF